ncbi:hypothetical protein [Novosphingobium terrae]|uniref:hypothetical protein n=1 Tax=Novosphingobium terrae TaxID=2726189 RepID=UPI00197F0BB5|nr:hypothetical protein [Novosphingobium terrae]
MATSPHFAAAAPLPDEGHTARLSPANDVQGETWLSPEDISDSLSSQRGDRAIHIEYVLIAAIWLGSMGAGLYRLLM